MCVGKLVSTKEREDAKRKKKLFQVKESNEERTKTCFLYILHRHFFPQSNVFPKFSLSVKFFSFKFYFPDILIIDKVVVKSLTLLTFPLRAHGIVLLWEKKNLEKCSSY